MSFRLWVILGEFWKMAVFLRSGLSRVYSRISCGIHEVFPEKSRTYIDSEGRTDTRKQAISRVINSTICVLVIGSPALAGEPPKPLPPVSVARHFLTDQISALLCKRDGYPYFVKLGKGYYVCAVTNEGEPDAREVGEVLAGMSK